MVRWVKAHLDGSSKWDVNLVVLPVIRYPLKMVHIAEIRAGISSHLYVPEVF
jgi:hypothetical protein